MTGERDCRGSVGVFFALILTTILAVICTSLESARHAALSYLTAQAGESALESVFAGYYKPLWEQYHLFFMADGPGFVPAAEETLACYEEPGNGRRGTDLMAFRTEEVILQDLITAVDQGGEAFLQAVMADMENHGAEELAEALLGRSELVKEAETVSGYIGSLSEYEETVSGMEERFFALEGQGYRLRKAYESLEAALEEGTLTEEAGRELLGEAQSLAAETFRQTEECYGAILAGAEELKSSLEREAARLSEQKETVSQASYEQMESEFENLTEYTREDGSRRTAAKQAKELLEECAGDLAGVKAWKDGAASEELKETVKKGSGALQVFEGKNAGTRQKSELLEMVKAWKDNGILGLVLENEKTVSDRRLSEKAGLPETVREEAGGRPVSALEKGAVVLYGAGHFGRFGEEKESTALAYEVEYLLGGLKSDRENLTKTAEKLLAVRSGMNFLYLLTDTGKQAEAEALAAVLAGFTGIYPLVKLVKGILLGAWAFAEAVSDVRILYQGGQVPLVKTGKDWRLSLEGAADAASYETGAKEEKGIWNYEGYLCILLCMGDAREQCFRMMELIEANLRKQDSGFFMENCISYALAEFRFQAEPLFFHLPLSGNSGYRFSKTAAYGYYELPQTEK